MKSNEDILKISKTEIIVFIFVVLALLGIFWFGRNNQPALPIINTPTPLIEFVTATLLPPVTPTRTPQPTYTVASTPTSVPTLDSPTLVPSHTPKPTLIPTLVPTLAHTSSPEAIISYMGGYTYTIQRDDNLWNLSINHYENPLFADVICVANKLQHDCNLIHAQNVISIPIILKED